MIDLILAENYPEFEHTVQSAVMAELVKLLSNDVKLSTFCLNGGIREITSLEVRGLGGFTTPSMQVYLVSDAITPQTAHSANCSMIFSIMLLINHADTINAKQALTRRILGYVQTLLHNTGNFVDDNGCQLTDNIVGFQLVEAARIENSNSVLHELQVTYEATIDERTLMPFVEGA